MTVKVKPNQDHVNGITVIDIVVNLTLPALGDSYDFFLVAFIDAPNALALGKFYFIENLTSSSVVQVFTCLCTNFLCPHTNGLYECVCMDMS